MSVYVLTGLLTPSECESARQLFPETRAAAVNVSDKEASQRTVRKSKSAFLKNNDNWLAERVLRVLIRANNTFRFDIVVDVKNVVELDTDRAYLARAEPLQLAEYSDGGEYGWHMDTGPGSADLRKLSASVQLSAPEDYDGGDLEIWGSPAIDRAQGTAVVFPSYQLHRVRPVTRGVRRSLVAWATGSEPFR